MQAHALFDPFMTPSRSHPAVLVPEALQNTKPVYFALFTQGPYKMDVALTRKGRL
jgi:hypothetical protein